MTAFVVYESEFGATRLIAEAIATGLGAYVPVELVNVHQVDTTDLSRDDLLVVGAPTHGRMLPSAASRSDAAAHSSADWRSHRLEPDPFAVGVREWLASLTVDATHCAAFTTRAHMARVLSGSAAPGILRRLKKAGGRAFAESADFLVDKQGELVVEELERALDWGVALGAQLQQAYTPEAAWR